MAKITGNEISPGTMLNYDGGLWIAVKTVKEAVNRTLDIMGQNSPETTCMLN